MAKTLPVQDYKIFISYRRKSWPSAHKLAEDLGKILDAEIFIDFKSIDDSDFEKSILRNLRDSDVVVVIVTEDTFSDRIREDSDWVRREIREAMSLEKPIVLALFDGMLPPNDLPSDIKEISKKEGIRFFPDFFDEGVSRLARFIAKITEIPIKDTHIPKQPTLRANQHNIFPRSVIITVVIAAIVLVVISSVLVQYQSPTLTPSTIASMTSDTRFISDSPEVATLIKQTMEALPPPQSWNLGDVLYITTRSTLRIMVDSQEPIDTEHADLFSGDEVVVVKNVEGRILHPGVNEWWWHVRPSTEVSGGGWIPQSLLTETPPNDWGVGSQLVANNPGKTIWLRQTPNGSQIVKTVKHNSSLVVTDEIPSWIDGQWWWSVNVLGESSTIGWVEQSLLELQ